MATRTIDAERKHYTSNPFLLAHVSDRVRDGAVVVVGEALVGSAKVFDIPGFSRNKVTRARNGGGPVAEIDLMFLAMQKAKRGPEGADRVIAHFQSMRDALWGEAQDMDRLHVAEQEAEGAENNATLAYMLDPSDDNARALAAAIRAEQAQDAARLAELERRHNLGRAQ